MEDDIFGRTLGDPEVDYAVGIDGDTVTVYAAGDIIEQAVIEGASRL